MALKDELRSQGNFLFKYRSYLPVLIIIAGIIVLVDTKLNSVNEPWHATYDIACVIVSFIGLLIRILAIGYSADNTSGRNTSAGQIADDINSTGLYSICRHPLYVGNFFMWLGIAMLTLNFWFLISFTYLYWLYYERIIFAEESFLIKKYGTKYTDYAATAPAFIPELSKWKKPQNKFSWVKIIRQEKTGILNLFIMVYMFKSIGAFLTDGKYYNLQSYWFWGLVIGIVWYIIIKLIQKNTTLLNTDR